MLFTECLPNIHGTKSELQLVGTTLQRESQKHFQKNLVPIAQLVGSREKFHSYISKKMWIYCAPIICGQLQKSQYASDVIALYEELDSVAHINELDSNQLGELAFLPQFRKNEKILISMFKEPLASDYDFIFPGIQFPYGPIINVPVKECGAYIEFHSDL